MASLLFYVLVNTMPCETVSRAVYERVLLRVRQAIIEVLGTICGSAPCAQESADPAPPIGRDEERCEEAAIPEWDSLPSGILQNILQRVELRDLFRYKLLPKSCKKLIETDEFSKSVGANSSSDNFFFGSFAAIKYYIKHNAWQYRGFDLRCKSWRSLSTLSFLPPPDAEFFKEYSVHGHGGLMCAEVSKLAKNGELVVFNSVTGKSKALPPLLHPRKPVLVHILADSTLKSYKVTVAGSSSASDEHLSRKMEILDSSTFKWKEAGDLPGPAFGLNEHQAGVCLDGKLFFISFLEGDCRRGVVAFDMDKGEWLENLECPIPFSSYSNTLQLVESDGKLYLFSEQERGQCVEHCIDELECHSSETGTEAWQWRTVVRVRKSGGRGLLVYPEYSCVGFGEGKLLIFDVLNRDGVMYDMRDKRQCEVLDFHRVSRLRFSPQFTPSSPQFKPTYFVKDRLLLQLLLLASMLIGAGADDQSGKLDPATVWGIRDYAKETAVTLLVGFFILGLMRFMARVAGRHPQGPPAPGNAFNIMEGLKNSAIPSKSNAVFEILPEIP